MNNDEQIPEGLTEAVRKVLDLVAQRDWDTLTKTARIDPGNWADLERVLDEYGRTFIPLPKKFCLYIYHANDETHPFECPLWSKEEGQSDLELRGNASRNSDGTWAIIVQDLLVP